MLQIGGNGGDKTTVSLIGIYKIAVSTGRFYGARYVVAMDFYYNTGFVQRLGSRDHATLVDSQEIIFSGRVIGISVLSDDWLIKSVEFNIDNSNTKILSAGVSSEDYKEYNMMENNYIKFTYDNEFIGSVGILADDFPDLYRYSYVGKILPISGLVSIDGLEKITVTSGSYSYSEEYHVISIDFRYRGGFTKHIGRDEDDHASSQPTETVTREIEFSGRLTDFIGYASDEGLSGIDFIIDENW